MSAPAIRLDGVEKRYRTIGRYFGRQRTEVHAVQDVSLTIGAGQSFGLVGESGSGKSTLARLIMGLENLPPVRSRWTACVCRHAGLSNVSPCAAVCRSCSRIPMDRSIR